MRPSTFGWRQDRQSPAWIVMGLRPTAVGTLALPESTFAQYASLEEMTPPRCVHAGSGGPRFAQWRVSGSSPRVGNLAPLARCAAHPCRIIPVCGEHGIGITSTLNCRADHPRAGNVVPPQHGATMEGMDVCASSIVQAAVSCTVEASVFRLRFALSGCRFDD